VKQCRILHHLIWPFEIRQQFKWRFDQACRIRMTNHAEEKSTHDEFGWLFYTAFSEIYNSVKCVKKFWSLGICPPKPGTFTQDFIHAYLEITNTEDPVTENERLGILPPSTGVITNVPPSPNVIRNANLTSDGNFFPELSRSFLEKLCYRKRRKQLTLK